MKNIFLKNSKITYRKNYWGNPMILLALLAIFTLILQGCISREQAESILKTSDVTKKTQENEKITTKASNDKKLGVVSENKVTSSGLSKNPDSLIKVQDLTPAAIGDEPRTSRSSSRKINSVEKSIKTALRYGKYNTVLRLTENSTAEKLVYYRAIAFFSLSLKTNNYNASKRNGFAQNAESLFTRLQNNPKTSDEIRSRALFWNAIATNNASYNSKTKMKALGLLQQLRDEHPNSSMYSDSLFYSATIHYQLEKFRTSEALFNRLRVYTSKYDRFVYDRTTKKFITPKKAAALGKQRIKRYKKFFLKS